MVNMVDNGRYRPDIDGLRAVAVGLVVAYHFFPNHFKAGFIGVDVFFVISGYLISGIIMEQMEAARWGYREFYKRRINRIFPALAFILFVNLIIGWYALLPNEFRAIGKQITASVGFVANFTFWSEAGYFDSVADTKPLLHLWSLAIEEQFYILWPVILVLAFQRGFFWVVGGLVAASLIYSIYASFENPTAAYYSPISRFYELGVGGMLANIHRLVGEADNRWAQGLSMAGAVLLAAGMAVITKESPFPGIYGLLPTLGAAALIASGRNGFINRWFLAQKPMVWIGLISYPLYLWHWPLLVWAKTLTMTNVLGSVHRIGLICTSVALAALTYWFVERPFRSRNTTSTTTVLAGVTVVLGLIGILFWSGSIPNRLNDPKLEPVIAAANDWAYPSPGMVVQKTFLDYAFYRLPGNAPGATLYIGDSNMEQYAPRIAAVISHEQNVKSAIFATKAGCPFASPALARAKRDCAGKLDSIDSLVRSDEVTTVVLAQQWLDLNQLVTDEAAVQSFEQFLANIPDGKRIYIVLNIPTGIGFGLTDALKGSRLGNLTLNPARYRNASKAIAELRPLNTLIHTIAARHEASVIDPFDTLCRNEECMFTDDQGRPAYKDRTHLAASFSAKHATYLDQTINSGDLGRTERH